jgi:NAD(P)-dependent dehydrogenase (short-subunit alcohol dehydrogenase family)
VTDDTQPRRVDGGKEPAGRRGGADRSASNRIALVTGVSGVLGQAIASELLSRGYEVVGTYRRHRDVAEVFAAGVADHGGKLQLFHCDVNADDSVSELRSRLAADQRLPAVLVNCAGITDSAPMLTLSTERFMQVVDTNLHGSFRVTKAFLRDMLRQRYGRIVLIGSVAAHWGARGQTNYSASKAALLGLARALTREVAARNITVNVIAPGPIDSAMMREGDHVDLDALSMIIPANRLGDPAEVAYVVAMLCDERASYVTGALIPVDGGMGMGA